MGKLGWLLSSSSENNKYYSGSQIKLIVIWFKKKSLLASHVNVIVYQGDAMRSSHKESLSICVCNYIFV